MRIIDYGFAWILFALGVIALVWTEIVHPKGAVLDSPLLWIMVAMFNLLRLRNGYHVSGLKVFCVGANLALLVLESVRVRMFGPLNLIEAVPILAETLFSVAGRNDANPS